jgi:hypothetical protein
MSIVYPHHSNANTVKKGKMPWDAIESVKSGANNGGFNNLERDIITVLEPLSKNNLYSSS